MSISMSGKFFRSALPLLLIAVFQPIANASDLLDTYRTALQNDPVFLSAQYRQLVAVESRPQARSALLPQFDFDANIGRKDVAGDAQGNFDSNGIGLTLTQSIYNRANYIVLSQADLQILQAEADYASAHQSLLLRSAERYFDILAAGDNLEFTRSEKNAIKRQLEQAERRFEVGLIAITDVKEAQAQYDLAVADEIAADNELATANEAMRVLTGAYQRALLPLGEESPLVAPTPENIEAWVSTANDNNLQLRIARIDTEIAKKSIDLQRAARLPDTSLIGSYTNRHDGSLVGDSELSQIRIQVSVPLYTGGLVGSRVRQANASFELARQQQDSERRSTEQQTRNAYRNVRADISRVKALKQALISTQSAAEATEAGFDVGTRTAVEVLISLRGVFRAKANHAGSRYDYILNSLRLRQAVGTLSVSDIETVNSLLGR
jgi:outer membrane protein